MMEGVLFSEKQYFRQPWMWLPLGGLAFLSLWAFIQQIVLGAPWGDNPAPDVLLIVLIAVFGLAFPLFFFFLHLSVIVEQDRMLVRFFPFHIKYRVFTKVGVASHRVVDYRPLRDYGGWGIRYGMKGKAYNVSGDRGVLFELPDGSSLLIGSGRADELDASISMMERRVTKAQTKNAYGPRSDWLRKV